MQPVTVWIMAKSHFNILIIDDDEADRVIYKKILSGDMLDRECTFHEVSTGRQGIQAYLDIRPDCALLDYMLPDITGLDVLNELHETSDILPIVILTGQGNETIAVDMIKRGAQEYLPKHALNTQTLWRAIINAISRADLLRKVAAQNEELRISKEIAEQESKRAIAADKAKTEFLATMSHEIRTPMNGIIGMAELLTFSPLDEKQEEYVGSIRSSGELLLTIINDTLDFAKIEARQLEFEKKPVILRNLLEDIIRLLQKRADENRISIHVSWPDGFSMPVIETDPVRLRQILINIIGNALKFTKNGSVHICITDLGRTEEAIELKFEIEDTGIGIAPEKIDAIFNRFTQADSSTTRKYGGTGLGLAICKLLVEMMGGTIGVESKPGEGSLFWFQLKFSVLGKAKNTNEKFMSDTLSPLPDEMPCLNGHILIVEDDRVGQRMAKSILQELGCTFDVAADGQEALDILAEKHAFYDLVLMDWQMPVMDGHEAIFHIRQNPWGEHLKIIALTANAVQGDREKCLAAGADDYMSKPVRLAAVITMLQKHIIPKNIALEHPAAVQ